MSDEPDDPGVGYNPAQRPHRHPAGRSCSGIIIAGAMSIALLRLLMRRPKE